MVRDTSNRVIHLELHTGDLARACAFYGALCGWRTEQIDAGGSSYLGLDLGLGVGGGVVECGTSQPMWMPYVDVPNVAASTERARRLGAAVLLEPREGPAGWRSVITSPAGAEVGFFQPKA